MLTLKGQPVPGELFPAAPGSPTLVLIHEYWGLNAHIRDVAARFAHEGFAVFAVDLYDGRIATDEAEAETLARTFDRELGLKRVVDAVQALREADPKTKVGVLGFCLGGGFAVAAAAASAEVAACVPFYGIGDQANVSKIHGKVQGHFASHDEWCAPSRVDAFEHRLKSSKIPFELHRYVANHAFFNDTRAEVYDAAAAKLAWERSLKFLNGVLR
jgi:carboxymethylenebutenolidase